MIIEIGIIAGEIIQLMERSKRPMRVLEIEILTDHPLRLVDMALGWLIREHFVRVINLGGEKFLFLSDKGLNFAQGSHAQYAGVN
jgi:hypothetical protein